VVKKLLHSLHAGAERRRLSDRPKA